MISIFESKRINFESFLKRIVTKRNARPVIVWDWETA